MLEWIIFIGAASLITVGFFIYFIPSNYSYVVKEKKKLTYLIPDTMLLISFILWVVLLMIVIYFLKLQGW